MATLCANHGEGVRLQGYDVPEITSPKCHREYTLAMRSRNRLQELIRHPSTRLFINPGTCGYNRRCGSLVVQGRDVCDTLIEEGLASRMVCHNNHCPPPADWCNLWR